ncbi:AAA family ATPase [Reichenbachiella versicolor]|uniref:AAA family ATPase n=1 Tax=Reichenbachiella versicolor TaxID=1821036 RepID=UPI000D6E0729|nr:ATP-binding protein [Reichenbachiella versicolor]
MTLPITTAVASNGHLTLTDFDKLSPDEKKVELLTRSFNAFQAAADWVQAVTDQRVIELDDKLPAIGFQEIMDVPQWPEHTAWNRLQNEMELKESEIFMLAFVYIGQFAPHTISKIWDHDELRYRVGGVQKEQTKRIKPTLSTILYLLSGEKTIKRAHYYPELVDSRLFNEQVLVAEDDKKEILDNQALRLNEEYYRWLMDGKRVQIDVSADFPAVLLDTHLTFDDLVLKESVTDQLEILMDFVKSQDEMYEDEEFSSKIKKGYVAMLYGPPGTGKTMTVAVMGKTLEIDVYCIDLSRVVSKYIGETEKNLEKIFKRLEHKRCILFFDEADALFGKRTEVKDSKDRYANQEVAYLLQKIERFPGLVILTSNYNQNLDSAFRRRILSSIFMPPPSESERYILWQKALPSTYRYMPEDLPERLSKEYSLTGANISNIIKLGCIKARKDEENPKQLTHSILAPIIKLEQHKEKNQ